MNASGLALLLVVLAAPSWSQGFAGMASDADGFALPAPDTDFNFPDDHGPHPDFRIEWWYVTANLTDAAGTAYGAQWTLFRTALAPGDRAGWSSPQIWFAHAAVTTDTLHLSAETRARGGIGQAGVKTRPFNAWINDWFMSAPGTANGDALAALDVHAKGAGFAYDLGLGTDRPLVLQGDKGFSVKSDRGQASYYYSQPFYTVTGRLTLPSGVVEVTGKAWLDREWSSQPLDADQTGWDWFSLHLDGGAQVMAYRMRNRDGTAYLSGTWIDADGTYRPMSGSEMQVTPQRTTRSNGGRVPTEWRLELPGQGVDVTVSALNPDSWMATTPSYWEGPVRITGSHTGTGYLEMTGYDD